MTSNNTTSTMQIAMLLAADHIEAHPRRFSFDTIDVPTNEHCGTPGCAFGWTAYYMAVVEGRTPMQRDWERLADELADCVFYRRMKHATGGISWMVDAAECARGMRIVAREL